MAMQRWNNQYPGTTPESSYTWKGQTQSKSSQPSWSTVVDPEMKRKKRIATYQVFTVEGKMKQTMRNSCRWLKAKYIGARYGWWWFLQASRCNRGRRGARSPTYFSRENQHNSLSKRNKEIFTFCCWAMKSCERVCTASRTSFVSTASKCCRVFCAGLFGIAACIDDISGRSG